MKKKDFAFRATGDLVAILEENRWRLKEPARRWDPMTRRITNDVWKPNIPTSKKEVLKLKANASQCYNSYYKLSKEQKKLVVIILEYLQTLEFENVDAPPLDLSLLVRVLDPYFREAMVGKSQPISASMFIQNMNSRIELIGSPNHYYIRLHK